MATTITIQGIYAAATVTDFETSLKWYSRFMGREPDDRPIPHMAQWRNMGAAGLQLWRDEERAGSALMTMSFPISRPNNIGWRRRASFRRARLAAASAPLPTISIRKTTASSWLSRQNSSGPDLSYAGKEAMAQSPLSLGASRNICKPDLVRTVIGEAFDNDATVADMRNAGMMKALLAGGGKGVAGAASVPRIIAHDGVDAMLSDLNVDALRGGGQRRQKRDPGGCDKQRPHR